MHNKKHLKDRDTHLSSKPSQYHPRSDRLQSQSDSNKGSNNQVQRRDDHHGGSQAYEQVSSQSWSQPVRNDETSSRRLR